MWAINLYSVLCVSCLMFFMIPRRHGEIQAAPIHSTHGPRGSTESSLQGSNSEIQSPKIDEAIMEPRRTQELVSVSGSNMGLPTGLSSKFSSKMRKNSRLTTVDNDRVSEEQKAGGKQRQGRAIKDRFARFGTGVTKSWPKELTIPLARGIVDSLGRRIKDPWTVTYGDVWRDTRLAAKFQSRNPRIHLASSPIVDYYPDDKNLISVCQSKSTVAGLTGMTMIDYVRIHDYKKAFPYRILEYDRFLRYQFTNYECHMYGTLETKVTEYLMCDTIATMRKEAYFKTYPKLQNLGVY